MDNVFSAWLAFTLPGFVFLLALLYMLFSLGGCCERVEELTIWAEDLDRRIDVLERIVEDFREKQQNKM